MGYTYACVIKEAAHHLLKLLKQGVAVPYSTFYDGTDETHDELERILDGDCPEHAFDLAVAQLEHFGLVETETRNETLADGEQDYWIRLRQRGRDWLSEPFELDFFDAE